MIQTYNMIILYGHTIISHYVLNL